ncbi:MAG: hypothetical protein ACI9XK_004772 [Granulosicoccus sp.]|jgi:uncharacterized protein YciI
MDSSGEGRQYIYTLRPSRPEMLTQGATASEEETLQHHVAYLKDLSEKSIVLLAGRTQTSDQATFGMVILKADSESKAFKIMAGDPAVKQGVMNAELFPYKISILSRDIVSEV